MKIIADNRGPPEYMGPFSCPQYVYAPCSACGATGEVDGVPCEICESGEVEVPCPECKGTGVFCASCEEAGGGNCCDCSSPDVDDDRPDPDDRDDWDRY